MFTVFMTGYLAEFITDDFWGLKINPKNMGYFFALWAFFYTISAFFVGPLAKKFSTRIISFCSYILLGLACLLFGPSHVLGIDTYNEEIKECNFKKNVCLRLEEFTPKECETWFFACRGEASTSTIVTLVISLILLGGAAGTVVVPILLELVQSIKDAMGVKPGANERGSALFTMGSALGSIIGNWVGGALYKKYRNPITCDIMAGMSFTMAFVYFLMNIYPGFLIKNVKKE